MKILATAIVGSYSYGLADSASDLDILVIGEKANFLDIKKEARKQYPSQDLHCVSNVSFLERFFIRGFFT